MLAPLVCFVAGSVYVARLSAEIGAASLSIATNGAPSVVYLARMRNDMRRVEQRAMMARQGSVPAARAAVAELTQDFDRAEVAYRLLPTYPGELALGQAMDRRREPFLAAVDGLLDGAGQGSAPPLEALARLRGTAEDLSEAIGAVMELNAGQVEAAGKTIAALRERTLWLSVARDALAFAFVAAGTALGVRASLQQASVSAERRRLDQARLAELDVFAGRVAHDLRDMLAVIGMRANLGEHAETRQAATEALARISRQSHRMSATIDALLGFARAAAPPAPGACSEAGAVAHEVAADARLLAGEADVEIRVEPITAAVACDATVLAVILSNLVKNSVKYAGQGPRAERRITLRARRLGSCALRFDVEDTGPGLPPGSEARAFEPFVQLGGGAGAKEGIGLGLATVKRLVEANGGAVGVDSRPGAGCCFWFTLPLAPGVTADASRRTPGTG